MLNQFENSFFESKLEIKTIRNWFRFIKKSFSNIPVTDGTMIPKNSIRNNFMNIKKNQ